MKWNPTDPGAIASAIAELHHKSQKKHWHSRVDECLQLIREGADVNGVAHKSTPIMFAASLGHLEMVRILLEHGADVNGGRQYNTPLLAALDFPEVKLSLLEHGAQLTIFTAVAEEDVEEVRRQVECDRSLVGARDEVDLSLLHHACMRLRTDVIRLLVEMGAEVNAVAAESFGIQPIHCAARHSEGNAEAIILLVHHGADVNARNAYRVTPLHMAVRDRSVEGVKILLENGADANAEDRGRGSTPLRRAVANTGRGGAGGKKSEAVEIIRLLLERGADPHHVNRNGKNLVDSAQDPQIRQILSEF